MMQRHAWTAVAGLVLVTACGMGSGGTAPTPVLVLTFADPVPTRFVTCGACEDPSTHLVAEFPITVTDPMGPGGNVERVDVVVRNVSRGSDVARNTRPNTTFTYADVHVPARGALTLEAGVVFAPPPPRDEIEVTVTVTLTDGRSVSRTARVTLAP